MGRKRHGGLDWLQQELSQLVKRARRKGKDADILTACGQLLQIEKERSDRETHAPTTTTPLETRFVVRYEDAQDRPDEIVHPYADAVRSALGYHDKPLPSVRADMSRLDLAAQLDHQAQRETGKTALAMRILAKVLRNELSLDDEVNHETIRALQNESGSEVERGDGQARGNNGS